MPVDLTEYVKNNLSRGVPKETIEANLLQSGWRKEQIDQAFVKLNEEPITPNIGNFVPPWKIPSEDIPFENNEPLPPEQPRSWTMAQNKWVYFIIITVSFVFFAYFTRQLLLRDINYTQTTLRVCSAYIQGCGLFFNTLFLSLLPQIILLATPGILIISIIKNLRKLPLFIFLVIGLMRLITYLRVYNEFSFTLLFKNILPIKVLDNYYFMNITLVFFIVFGATIALFQLMGNRLKELKLKDAILRLELGVFLVYLSLSLISPAHFTKLNNVILRPVSSISTTLRQPGETDKYAGWEGYTNHHGGYSLKYPKGWSLQATISSSEEGLGAVFITKNGDYQSKASIPRIQIYNNYVGPSPSQFCQQGCKIENIKISGIEGVKYNSKESEQDQIWFESKKLMIAIDSKGEDKVIDQIIDSITFTSTQF